MNGPHRRPLFDRFDALDTLELVDELKGALQRVLDIYDEHTDPVDGSWNSGNDIVEQVYDFLVAHVTGPRCSGPDHQGPVVIAGTETIDDGIAVTLRCETCKATTETSIGLDEVEWS